MHKLRNLLGPLRVFDAVNRAHGVTRAAEQLHVTPGAVSQQLKQLESAVNVKLFKKSGREIELTDPGRQLALRLAELFDRVEEAVAEVTEASRPRRLRLKLLPSFATKWLMPRLDAFHALHNEIEIQITTTSENDHLENADFIVRVGVGEWNDVHFDHLFDETFLPVCSPAMAATIRSPRDLLQAKLLHSAIRPRAWSVWLESAGLGDQVPIHDVTLASQAMCLQAAIDGLGLAVVQHNYVQEELRSGRLVAPVDKFVRTELGYDLVCDLHKANTYPLREFREWVRTLV